MIRVNLLNNIGLAQSAEPAYTVAPDATRLAAGKALAVLLLPLMLFVYQRINLNGLEEELQEVQKRVQTAERESAKFGDAGPKIEMYNKEKARIDKELEVLRSLAQARLREVKALHAIQNLMPNNTWAQKISIDASAVRLEGYTSAADGITGLIRALENDVYFSKIEPKVTQQVTVGDKILKRFELEFKIGK